MRVRFSSVITFLSGCIFTAFLLVRCGTGGSAHQDKPDGSTGIADAMADGYTSGSRLKLQVYKATDGAVQFISMYDSQLMMDCAFTVAADGQTRCLPTTWFESGYFSDNACKNPLLPSGCSGSPGGTYMLEGQPGLDDDVTCGKPFDYSVATIGAQFAGLTVYESNGSTCTAESVSVLPSVYASWWTTTPADPSLFVSATVTTQ